MKIKNKKILAVAVGAILAATAGIYGFKHISSSDSNLVFKGNSKNVIKQDKERENTYVIGVSQLPTKRCTFLETMEGADVVNQLVYLPLASYEKGNYTYHAAQSIVFSENGKKAHIILNSKACFSDGCSVNADDILYSYHFYCDADIDYYDKESFLGIDGAEEYQSGKAESISGIQKISDTELEITFQDASYDNLKIFEAAIIHPVSHDYETINENDEFLGCGSYKIVSHWMYQKVFLEANPYAAVKADYANIQIVPANVDSLEAQEIDTMVISESLLDTVEALGSYDIYMEVSKYRDFIVFNQENEIMSDSNMRKELVSLIDTEAIVNENYSSGIVSKGISDGDRNAPNYLSMDKNIYRRKLTEIVFQCGFFNEELRIENAVEEQLEKVEVSVEMQNVSETTSTVTDPNVSVFYYKGTIDDLIPEWNFEKFFQASDGKELRQFGDDLEEFLLDEMYAIPLHNEIYYNIELCQKKHLDLTSKVY